MQCMFIQCMFMQCMLMQCMFKWGLWVLPRPMAVLCCCLLLIAPVPAQTDSTENAGHERAGHTVPWCAETTQHHAVAHALWSLLDRKYALFDIRFPSNAWPDVGKEACKSITTETSDEELFEIMMTMVRRLDDGHIMLEAPELDLFDDAQLAEYPYREEMEALVDTIEEEYLDTPWSRAAHDAFCWGMIGDIGYLRITVLEGFTRRGTERHDVRQAGKVMKRIAESFADARGVIVDIRANDGGFDAVSLAIARWFAGDRVLAWSKRWRDGPGHHDFSNPPELLFVAASGAGAIALPVVVLTTPATFSAGDTLTLALRVRDHVTVMGEPTSGHLSDMYSEKLPNGWELSFSGELYRAADGEYYEKKGIPPDILVPFDPDLLAGHDRDNMLEAALQYLREHRQPVPAEIEPESARSSVLHHDVPDADAERAKRRMGIFRASPTRHRIQSPSTGEREDARCSKNASALCARAVPAQACRQTRRLGPATPPAQRRPKHTPAPASPQRRCSRSPSGSC